MTVMTLTELAKKSVTRYSRKFFRFGLKGLHPILLLYINPGFFKNDSLVVIRPSLFTYNHKKDAGMLWIFKLFTIVYISGQSWFTAYDSPVMIRPK